MILVHFLAKEELTGLIETVSMEGVHPKRRVQFVSRMNSTARTRDREQQ